MFTKRFRTAGVLSIGALMALAIGAAPVSAATPTVRMVDGDGHARDGNCNASNAAFSTIQSAISASHAGDTVKVCPGDYTENLVIGSGKDNVSVVSVKSFKAHIWRSINLAGETPLVDIRPGADGVLFKHFTLNFPDSNACDSPTSAAIEVGGTHASIRANRIKTDHHDPDFISCGYAIGINVGPEAFTMMTAGGTTTASVPAGFDAPPASALVGWNVVRDFQFVGVNVIGPDSSADTTRNSIHYGHQGSENCLSTSTASTGSHWKGASGLGRSGVTPTGIGVCFGVGIAYSVGASGEITGNAVLADFDLCMCTAGTSNDGPLLLGGIGIGFFAASGTVNAVNNEVGFALFGIGVETETTSQVSDNQVAFTLNYALGVERGSGVKMRRNEANESGGIFADQDTGGNLFKDNAANDGSCEDNSTGSDTAGTDNHWVGNTGDSSSPSGLCTPAL